MSRHSYKRDCKSTGSVKDVCLTSTKKTLNGGRLQGALTSMEVGEGVWRERDHILSGSNKESSRLCVKKAISQISRVVDNRTSASELRAQAITFPLPTRLEREVFLPCLHVCLRPGRSVPNRFIRFRGPGLGTSTGVQRTSSATSYRSLVLASYWITIILTSVDQRFFLT